jgi:aminoglycoside 3-N-acetyltransferase
MNGFTIPQLHAALDSVASQPGATVMVHASLFALGALQEVPPQDVVARCVAAVREHLGAGGTLVVPAFTYAFCRGLPFDRQHSPGEKMGTFSEYVRQLPDAVRSYHPIQSVAAVGAASRDICAVDTRDAFAQEGPFGVMLRAGAQLLLLGTSTRSASLIHYSEERVTVPYRFWKEFRGTYIDGGTASQRAYRMYARDLQLNPVMKLYGIGELMGSRLHSVTLGSGKISCCSFADYIETTTAVLRRDPWAFVERCTGVTAPHDQSPPPGT